MNKNQTERSYLWSADSYDRLLDDNWGDKLLAHLEQSHNNLRQFQYKTVEYELMLKQALQALYKMKERQARYRALIFSLAEQNKALIQQLTTKDYQGQPYYNSSISYKLEKIEYNNIQLQKE